MNNYYLHCYRSELGYPDLNEAKKIVEAKDPSQNKPTSSDVKRSIANALVQFNPVLENPEVDFNELAELWNISIEEARKNFDQIEIQTPPGEIGTQIVIHDSIVSISVPFGYSESDAVTAFANVDAYTKIIKRIAGYFAYDPQTGFVYDPSLADFDGLLVYLRRSGFAPMTRAQINLKKSWWKFWK